MQGAEVVVRKVSGDKIKFNSSQCWVKGMSLNIPALLSK